MTVVLPTEAEIVAARVTRGLSGANPLAERIQSDGKSTAALIRERAAEEADELDLFIEAIAEHFDCPAMVADHIRIKLRGPFLELRAMAHRPRGEAVRRGERWAQDEPAPARIRRDPGGRFTAG